jgi:hypothetical protein
MIETPNWLRERINIVYPPNNFEEFELWFHKYYEGDVTEREFLPIYWTSYYVNNNYGQDKEALRALQSYIDSLDKSKKYFTIIQYDDGILNDVSGIDLYQFNMSKSYDYPLPLIGQPHPYKFNSEKKYLANFIGSMTHPIREHAKTLIGKEGYYISFDRHEPYEYCKIISESVFTLCYRGYGINSFRISEALQYGSIPVYISDKFIYPHNISFMEYGVRFHSDVVNQLHNCLLTYYEDEIKELNKFGKKRYQELYTYEGTKDKILKHLLTLK